MFGDIYESKKATVFRIMAATLFMVLARDSILNFFYDDFSFLSVICLISSLLLLIGLLIEIKPIIVSGNLFMIICYIAKTINGSLPISLVFIIPYVFTIITILICTSNKLIIKNGTKPLGYFATVFLIVAFIIQHCFSTHAFNPKDILYILVYNIPQIFSVAFMNLWNIEVSKEN